jgi:predicted nuclease with TOPRIM domain
MAYGIIKFEKCLWRFEMNEELKEIFRSVLKEELEPIHEQLENFDQRFDEVDQRFTKIDERFDEVDHRFMKIDERFDEVDSNVKGFKDNLINGLVPYFERIITHIDEVKEITQNQQMIINTLSARSIQHESDINELKRIVKNR